MQWGDRRAARRRFTLVEVLVTIVVVGVLTAIAILGFTGLSSTSAVGACLATLSAATAASDAFYTQSHTYPQTFNDLTHPPTGKPLLETHNMTETATTLTGRNGWTLELIPGVTTSDQTDFQC